MSFSFSLEGKNGVDLLEKYGIHSQLLGGIAPNGHGHAPNELSDIRSVIHNSRYGKNHPKAAQDVWNTVKVMVAENLASVLAVEHPDCPKCDCHPPPPPWCDPVEMQKVLTVPTEEVVSIWGGW